MTTTASDREGCGRAAVRAGSCSILRHLFDAKWPYVEERAPPEAFVAVIWLWAGPVDALLAGPPGFVGGRTQRARRTVRFITPSLVERRRQVP
jgi:hypothetical protein